MAPWDSFALRHGESKYLAHSAARGNACRMLMVASKDSQLLIEHHLFTVCMVPGDID